MADPYPSFPEKKYRMSRILRVLTVSFVFATLAVSLLIVVFRFFYEQFTAGDYRDQGILLLLSVVLFTFVLARIIWDAAEGRYPVRRPAKK